MGREGTHLVLGLVLAGFLTGQAVAVGALRESSEPPSPSAAAVLHEAPATGTGDVATVVGRPIAAPSRAAAPATARPPIRHGDRKALLIGIDHAAGSPTLTGAVGDAKAMRDALLTFGYEPSDVVVLLDREATHERILAELRSLAARTPARGQAVFAFAGHTRRKGGRNHFVAADGRTVSADTLATHLRGVRAPMWVALPTCYAAGYRIPGITGPNRVATFASAANELSYESTAFDRSFLIEYMVVRGLLAGKSPPTVEAAFRFAHSTLSRNRPDRLPVIEDDHAGEFVLGSARYTPAGDDPTHGEPGLGLSRPAPAPAPPPDDDTPQPTPEPDDRKGLGTCGAVRFRCS